ncbi:MAG: DMT family transporter [Synergistaceae bacterium]|nr:DMT family transporter [Synergistaceae bacterium]
MQNGLLFAFLAAVCWGISPIFQKRGLTSMGLAELNAVRGLGVLAVLVPVYFFVLTDIPVPPPESFLILTIVAFVNNLVGDLFAFVAIRNIGAGLATPVTSSYPLVVALTSWLCFGEAMSSFVWGGTFVVVMGLVLLNVRVAMHSESQARYARGIMSAAVAALCWALGLSLNKYLTLHGLSPTTVIFWRGICFSFMALAAWVFFRVSAKPQPPQSRGKIPALALGAGLGAGILSLVVGTWCYTFGITLIPMSVATPIAASCPLITALLACAFAGERLRPVQWLGIVFVVAGAVMVSV